MKFRPLLATDLSGSLGGITASHNRAGAYFRNRAIPTDPATSYQVAVRNLVASLTSHWLNTLTDAQRAAWEVYANSVFLPDALGEPRNISALAHYCRTNVPALQAGLDRQDDAPTVFNLGEFTNPTFDNFSASATTFDLTFDNTDAWANEDGSAMLVYASRNYNPSINFFKGPYRYAQMIEGDAVTPPTSPASITCPFPIVAANKTFVYIRVTRADGRLSALFRGFGLGA